MIYGQGLRPLTFRLTCLTAAYDSGVYNLLNLLIQFTQIDMIY